MLGTFVRALTALPVLYAGHYDSCINGLPYVSIPASYCFKAICHLIPGALHRELVVACDLDLLLFETILLLRTYMRSSTNACVDLDSTDTLRCYTSIASNTSFNLLWSGFIRDSCQAMASLGGGEQFLLPGAVP